MSRVWLGFVILWLLLVVSDRCVVGVIVLGL